MAMCKSLRKKKRLRDLPIRSIASEACTVQVCTVSTEFFWDVKMYTVLRREWVKRARWEKKREHCKETKRGREVVGTFASFLLTGRTLIEPGPLIITTTKRKSPRIFCSLLYERLSSFMSQRLSSLCRDIRL